MKIKIGYTDYAIKYTDVENEHDKWGVAIHKKSELLIEQDLSHRNQQEVLIHEILHCIDLVFMNEELSEKQVDSLGKGLATVFRDNPDLFKSIIDGLVKG